MASIQGTGFHDISSQATALSLLHAGGLGQEQTQSLLLPAARATASHADHPPVHRTSLAL